MGRELRMVPENWEHPKDKNNQLIPLLEYSFKEQLRDWIEEKKQWNNGFRKNWFSKENENKWVPLEGDEKIRTWEEWSGGKPTKSNYMPEWEDKERTHFQMYEDCTEGTPISPVMNNIEKLAHWLTDNNASSFGSMTATYEQWLSTIKRGFAPSMIISGGKMDSGVAAL